MLLLVEDAQWLDRASADVLAFVARRLEPEPIVMLVAVRDGFASPARGRGAAGAPARAARTRRRAGALLDARAPRLAPTVRDRMLREAAGNPLALVELPVALEAARRRAPAPAWLPLTTRLEQAFAARVADAAEPTGRCCWSPRSTTAARWPRRSTRRAGHRARR